MPFAPVEKTAVLKPGKFIGLLRPGKKCLLGVSHFGFFQMSLHACILLIKLHPVPNGAASQAFVSSDFLDVLRFAVLFMQFLFQASTCFFDF